MDDTTKKCTRCKKVKPLDEFSINATMKDGHANKCKECRAGRARGKYRDNVNQKKCARCGGTALVSEVDGNLTYHSLCFDHWMKMLARRHGGTSEMLNEAWNEQHEKCFYTGERLIPCVNATWRNGKWMVYRMAKILDSGTIKDMKVVIEKEIRSDKSISQGII